MVGNYLSINEHDRSNGSALNENQNQNERTELLSRELYTIRWCGVRRSTVLLLCYIIGYFGYIFIGAYIMYLLETNVEIDLKEKIHLAKKSFLKEHDSISKSELEEFLENIVGNKGISPLKKDRFQRNWSLGQSVLYTSTVITTIGYGHISPLTTWGKMFTIIYACVGIPITLLFMSIIAKRITEPISKLLQRVVSMIVHKPRDLRIKSLEVSLIFFIILSLFHLIPAIIFTLLEPQWHYLDALYYTFISLTTIGLGDYIPGDDAEGIYRPLYKSLIVVYLLLGLMMMSVVAELYYGIPELSLTKYFQKSMDVPAFNIERPKRITIRPRSKSAPP